MELSPGLPKPHLFPDLGKALGLKNPYFIGISGWEGQP
jgi:hypothetical protein